MLLYWPFVRRFHQWQVKSSHKGQYCRKFPCHYDIIKWKHFLHYWPFVWGIHRSPVNSPHKGQWCGAFMFSLICAWIKNWVNNREAGDLRCHRAYYDVILKSWHHGSWIFIQDILYIKKALPRRKSHGGQCCLFIALAATLPCHIFAIAPVNRNTGILDPFYIMSLFLIIYIAFILFLELISYRHPTEMGICEANKWNPSYSSLS